MSEFNASIGKQYKKSTEKVSWVKFRAGMVDLISPVKWLKEIHSIFNLRKILIFGIIIGGIFAYGWYQGKTNAPLKINIGEYRESFIKLHDETLLHIDKNGNVTIQDKDGNIIKRLRNKDLDALRKQLTPIGLQLKPIAVFGGGIDTSGTFAGEVGIGLRWFRAWAFRIDSILTNQGIYPLGLSYKLDDIGLKNSAIGIGVGTSYDKFLEDKRVLIYFSLEF